MLRKCGNDKRNTDGICNKNAEPVEQQSRALCMPHTTVVLIGDVHFVKRSRRYRNTNYWRRDLCINKHLDQNERLDDFGTRTRPQFIFLTVIWIFMKWNARAQWVSRRGPRLFPCLPYMWMVESSFVLQSIQKVYDDWFVAAWKITLFPNPVGKFTSRSWPSTKLRIAVVWCFLNSSRPNFIFANSNAGPINRGFQVHPW